MYLKGTARCFLLIIFLYLITVCLVYNCLLDLKIGSLNFLLERNNLAPKEKASKDVYKLQWNAKDKVFFKKVRSVKTLHTNPNSKNDSSDDASSRENKSNNYIKVTNDFYIFSAFYDDRVITRYVRMIASLKKYSEKRNSYWCHFQASHAAERHSAYVSSKLIYYQMCENHKRSIGGWILSCLVPEDVISVPTVFWISTSVVYQNVHTNRTTVPITKVVDNMVSPSKSRASGKVQGQFGICVPPLFGTIEPKAFIEFLEFSKLLGVNKIFFYIYDIQDEIKKILNYYKSRNFIHTIPWELPFSRKSVWNYGQSLAVNDCLYRHMFEVDFLAFLDIDEVLVPRKDDKTWRDLIESVSQSMQSDLNSFSGFTFRSTFFDPESSRPVSFNEANSVIRVNRTTRFSFFRNKVLVRPSRVFELGIHHVSRSWPDYKNYSVAKTDPNLAAVHHYRTCINEFGINCKAIKEDTTVLKKYGEELTENINYHMMNILR